MLNNRPRVRRDTFLDPKVFGAAALALKVLPVNSDTSPRYGGRITCVYAQHLELRARVLVGL